MEPTAIGETETASGLETALARYKLGKCPCCGKGVGEPRGLEYRRRAQDVYCHSCRKSWPLEMDVAKMRLELSIQEAPQSGKDVCPIEVVGERPPRAVRPRRFTDLIGLLGLRRQ